MNWPAKTAEERVLTALLFCARFSARHGPSSSARETDFDPKPGSRSWDDNLRVMQIGYCPYETEAEAASRRRPALFQLIEPPEYLLAFAVGNSGPVVLDPSRFRRLTHLGQH